MRRVLLVLDDEDDIAELFRRFLKKAFDEIHLARNSSEAEAVLERAEVTHLVSDFWIGPGEPIGSSLIARWRQRWPAIRFAALFTGGTREKLGPAIEGVDALFIKPNGFDDLIDRLRID